MRVDYKTYTQDKADYIQKQGCNWKVDTSPLDGKVWFKTYYFENGATFYERYEHKTFEKYVEVIAGLCAAASVDVLEVEYWSDEQESKIYYEKW